MTNTIQIPVHHVEPNYSWAACGNMIARSFINEAFAEQFAEQFGGSQITNKVLKPCGNTVKFTPSAYHAVCPACGAIWQLDGDIGRLDDEKEPIC